MSENQGSKGNGGDVELNRLWCKHGWLSGLHNAFDWMLDNKFVFECQINVLTSSYDCNDVCGLSLKFAWSVCMDAHNCFTADITILYRN